MLAKFILSLLIVGLQIVPVNNYVLGNQKAEIVLDIYNYKNAFSNTIIWLTL